MPISDNAAIHSGRDTTNLYNCSNCGEPCKMNARLERWMCARRGVKNYAAIKENAALCWVCARLHCSAIAEAAAYLKEIGGIE